MKYNSDSKMKYQDDDGVEMKKVVSSLNGYDLASRDSKIEDI